MYFPEDDTVAQVKEINILEPSVSKMKKGVSCSVEWSDGCIYAGKILGIGKEVMYMYIVDRSCDYSLCKTIAGTKQEINSLAIEYERDRASVPNDDCVDPKRKKRRLGQFHKQYTFLLQ